MPIRLRPGKKMTMKKTIKKKITKRKIKKAVKKVSRSLNPRSLQKITKKSLPGVARAPIAIVLKPGSRAPDFKALTDESTSLSLKDLAGKKVILYFYPKDDTPGCTRQSCDFRDSFTRVKAAGATVIGVSRDSVGSHQKFKAKFSFPFSLLSDADGQITENYGVWQEKSMYGRKYMGIVRTTFMLEVSPSGRAKVLKIYPKVKVSGHVDEILLDLKNLPQSG